MFPQQMVNIGIPSNVAQQIVLVQPIQAMQPIQSNYNCNAFQPTATYVMISNPLNQLQTGVLHNNYTLNNRYIQPQAQLSRQVLMNNCNPFLMTNGPTFSSNNGGHRHNHHHAIRRQTPCALHSFSRPMGQNMNAFNSNINSIPTYGTLRPQTCNRLQPQTCGALQPTLGERRNNTNNARMAPAANVKPETAVKRTTNTHSESDGFKCDQCERVFVRKVNLNAHKKIHTAFAYVCEYCNKKFARKSNLEQHIRIHTDERPYCCIYCPRTFRQQHSLKGHLRTHTGEKPYQCTHCRKRFAAKCNLKVHLRTHTGEKPYACLPCNKKYASKSGYNAHIRKFHGVDATQSNHKHGP